MDLNNSGGADVDPTQVVWVDLEFRNDRLFGRLQGTDLVVSGRSMRTLRSKVIDALPPESTPMQVQDLRIYWLHNGTEISYDGVVVEWQIHRQSQVDTKARVLRSEDPDSDGVAGRTGR